MIMKKNQKLSPKYYGPYQVIEKVGIVAYKLEFPADSCIHPVFHVSNLKKKVGEDITTQNQLPPIFYSGELHLNPEKILAWRIVKRGNHIITKILVKWHGCEEADATWEGYHQLQQRFPDLHLEDKVLEEEGYVMCNG